MTTEDYKWSLSENRRTVSLNRVSSLVGQEIFVTNWRQVDRLHLDQFHWSVDEVEETSDMSANAKFPRGEENIDGFMLLSLVTSAFFNNYPIGGENVIAWNYGLDRVRFPATTYLEDRIRLCVSLNEAVQKDSGLLTTNHVVVEIEDKERPAMVADFLVMLTDPEK
jgi:acyl dehydratase